MRIFSDPVASLAEFAAAKFENDWLYGGSLSRYFSNNVLAASIATLYDTKEPESKTVANKVLCWLIL